LTKVYFLLKMSALKFFRRIKMLENPKARPIVDAYLAPGSAERRALGATKVLGRLLGLGGAAMIATIPVFDIGFNIYKFRWVNDNPTNVNARSRCEKEVNDGKEKFKLEKIEEILGGNTANSDKLKAIDKTVYGYNYPDSLLNKDCDINRISFPDKDYQWLYAAKDLAFKGSVGALFSGIALCRLYRRKTVGTLNQKILDNTVQPNGLIDGAKAAGFVGLYYDFNKKERPENFFLNLTAQSLGDLESGFKGTLRAIFDFETDNSSSLTSLLFAERARPVRDGLGSAANVISDDDKLLIRAINALTTLTLLSGETEYEKEIGTFLKKKIGYYNNNINREINFHEMVIEACKIDAINNWFKEQFGDELWNDIKGSLANRQPLTEDQVNVIRILPERTLLVAPALKELQAQAILEQVAGR
jgi:hypothetical protein